MRRHVEASASMRAGLPDATDVLCDPVDVVGRRGNEAGTYLREMVAELHDGTSVRQDVIVQVGVAERSNGVIRFTLAWCPAGHERLLPSFDGMLALEVDAMGGTRLRIRGTYRPPLGPVGV